MGEPNLYYEDVGEGVPILLIHPSGSTASTWGTVPHELGRIGRVITYDRRGYARSGGDPVRKLSTHTADAAALLDSLQAPPAIVPGTSSGAIIALDLAVHRPDLVHAVVEHEGPWRFARHLPTGSQVRTFAAMASFALRGRPSDAVEALLRSAYAYREGGSAWDVFPGDWRIAGRENAQATLWDFLMTIGNHPTATELATIQAPVVCSYGSRSPDFMVRCTRSLAAAIPAGKVRRIEGAAHAAPFDAPTNFVELIAGTVTDRHGGDPSKRRWDRETVHQGRRQR